MKSITRNIIALNTMMQINAKALLIFHSFLLDHARISWLYDNLLYLHMAYYFDFY